MDLRGESGRILLTALGETGVSDADKTYLTQLVAANTGIDQATAAKRADDAIAQVKKTEAELKQNACAIALGVVNPQASNSARVGSSL